MTATQFDSAVETASQAGWSQVSLFRTVDGVTATTLLSGYNSPGGNTPSTTLRVTYTLVGPFNRVRGLRLWNQCGGDLNDADGLGVFDAEFYAGAALLATHSFTGVNGGAAQDLLIPALGELNGVDSVVLRNLSKQQTGTIAPLWRELQLLSIEDVFECRRRNGTVEWYDDAGNLIPTASLVPCETEQAPEQTPLNLTNVTMTEGALGDDPGLGERMCNVVPPVTSSSGYTVLAGPCYDGSGGTDLLNWNGPLTSISMSYESGGSPGAGAALVNFSSPATGTITWPGNATPMTVGEIRRSNLFPGGYATITYLAPAGSPASGAPRQDGNPNIRLGPAAIQAYTPYHFRIDFWAI